MKASVYFTSKLLAAGFAVALAAVSAGAQEPGRLRLDSLDRLAPRAVETVNVEIGGTLIGFGCSLLSDKEPDERRVKEMCSGLKGVYLKGYEFQSGGQFADADVADLRAQLRGPGWTKFVDVSNRDEDPETAEVYAATEAGRVRGLAILVVTPKELTVINIVGAVDLDKLRQLEGVLNLPRIRIERKKKTHKP